MERFKKLLRVLYFNVSYAVQDQVKFTAAFRLQLDDFADTCRYSFANAFWLALRLSQNNSLNRLDLVPP